MEIPIAAQSESRGIRYEGDQNEFKECIFEVQESDRHERYEFRCNADLECCGRTCCNPEDGIILALVLLAVILGLLAYRFCKRKPKPKKEKFIPSPMEETLLEKPKPVRIIQHNEDEISRASVPETVEMSPPPAQKAQLAFYRSQVDQVLSYNPVE